MKHACEPATSILEKLGGSRVVAEHLGIRRSSVARWRIAPPNGSGGVIPASHVPALMELADARGAPLAITEFFGEAVPASVNLPGRRAGGAVSRGS